MEIELDWSRSNKTWQVIACVLGILCLMGLAVLGSHVTPVNAEGSPKLLSWSDWRYLQAEHAYQAELAVLQNDASQLASMLNSRPSPVATQILAERIAKHTKSGDASLATAREKLAMAAFDVRDWSAGTLDRDTAIQSVQDVESLLQQ